MAHEHTIKEERDAAMKPKTLSVQEESGRPSKRQRLAAPEILTRTQDPELALEVDHMILDYVAYQATNAVLSKYGAAATDPANYVSAEHNMAMTDSFLEIFKAKYPTYQPDAGLRFRVLLLKLSTLFLERLTRNETVPPRQVLQDLRAENQTRARDWIGSADRIPSNEYNVSQFENDLPLPLNNLERNRAHVLHMLSATAEDEAYEDAFYGTPSNLALLDLLPSFMQVSAARNAISGSNLTEQWMHLAGQFMLQACLEQYLVRGSSGSDAIDETFSWGYKPPLTTKEDQGEFDSAFADEVNDTFASEAHPKMEVKSWSIIKSTYLRQLILPATDHNNNNRPQTTSLTTHLEQIASKHPISDFQKSMLGFLTALSASMPAPVLTQLETGQLDGFSEEETAEFVRECGLGEGWPVVT